MTLALQDSLPLGVTLKHTVASKRGQQWVEQCAHCGTLICVSSTGAQHTTRGKLGACPACGDTRWTLQYVPSDGLGMFLIDKDAAQ